MNDVLWKKEETRLKWWIELFLFATNCMHFDSFDSFDSEPHSRATVRLARAICVLRDYYELLQ